MVGPLANWYVSIAVRKELKTYWFNYDFEFFIQLYNEHYLVKYPTQTVTFQLSNKYVNHAFNSKGVINF